MTRPFLCTLLAMGFLASPAGAEEAASPTTLLKLGRLSRELGDYTLSSSYYTSYLNTKPSSKIAGKVTEELKSCKLLAAGWQLPAKEKDDLLIMQMRGILPLIPPEEAEPKLDALIKQCPNRWEAHALRAQNRFRQGRFGDALKNLENAYAKGGMPARLATAALEKESREHQQTLDIAKKAQGLLAARKTTAAADLLQTAWKEDPSRVEFGLKAAQLLVAKKDFKTAGSICQALSEYLEKHPGHPQGPNAPLIRMVATNCTQGASLKEKLGGSAVASSSSASGGASSAKPRSSSSGAASKKASSAPKGMSARFKQLKK